MRISFDQTSVKRATALVAMAAFAFTFGGCSRSASTTTIEPAPDSTLAPGALSQRYADAAAAIPADRYDIAARAAELPAGVDASFAVARDEIRAESYSGVLLGGAGAYENRGANSVDRALVLGQLLAAKNIPVRYASCRLDAATAEVLATRLFAPAPAAPAATAAAGDDTTYARILARGGRDLAAVKSALGGAPAYAGTSHADLIAELEDHTWVQAKPNGSDWVDLDPSFADAAPGKTYCTPASTVDTVPDSALQTVTIRVGAETLDSGSLSDSVLLEQSLSASALRDKQIYVTQAPGSGASVGFDDKSKYEPVLAVDGEFYPGKAVRFADGTIGQGGAGSTLDEVNNALAAETPAGASASPVRGPYLVAEWLEFTVTLPNGKSDTTRRFLFDRAGSAWRAASVHDPAKLVPMRSDENGPLAAQSVFEICVSAGRHDLRSYWSALSDFQQAYARLASAPQTPAASAAASKSPDFFATMWPFWLRNSAFALVSDERVIPSLDDRPGVRFYADSPRIFVFGAGVDPKTGGTFVDSDLRRDSIRAVAADAGGASTIADGILQFGVMEGALEAELAAPPQGIRTAGTSFGSTSDLLGPSGLTVLRPGADLSGVSDPETAARMQAALHNGATLVVPSEVLQSGPGGWWEVARDASAVRAVFDEDLGGTRRNFSLRIGRTAVFSPHARRRLCTRFVGGNGAGTRGGATYIVDPATYGGRGRAAPAATRTKSGGGELGEYASLILLIAVVAVPVLAILGLVIYYYLVKKPALDAIQ